MLSERTSATGDRWSATGGCYRTSPVAHILPKSANFFWQKIGKLCLKIAKKLPKNAKILPGTAKYLPQIRVKVNVRFKLIFPIALPPTARHRFPVAPVLL